MLIPAPRAPRLLRLARRAWADRRGVAAIEFAFIAPIMIVMFFGLAQLSQAIVANRHTSHAAAAVGDLVAQCSNINDSDFANIFAAGGDMIAPLPANTSVLAQRVTSVQQTGNGPQVQWSQAADKPGMTNAYTVGQSVTNLPPNILSSTNGDSVILDQTVYAYTFPVSTGGLIPQGGNNLSLSFGNAITFDFVTYFKPRRSAAVTYTGSGSGGSGTQTSCYGN